MGASRYTKSRITVRQNFLLLVIFFIAGCSQLPNFFDQKLSTNNQPDKLKNLAKDRPVKFTKIAYNKLGGWSSDKHSKALNTFVKSCRNVESKPSGQRLGIRGFDGLIDAYQRACEVAQMINKKMSDNASRVFFENWFEPYKIESLGSDFGLFTGYYEPELNGSRIFSEKFKFPIYKRPKDLISSNLGLFKQKWKGRQISGRLQGNRVVPFATRESIESGALIGKGLELLWVDNAIDAFFLHIQGSGRIRLDTGEVVRVGFSGRNGQPYFAIGRDLVKMGELTKSNVSMQTIRTWLERNPDKASDLMNKNKSYVFFREIKNIITAKHSGLGATGPIGAAGIPLTAGRSLAIDRAYFSMGLLFWIDTRHPLTQNPLRKLMVSQDTGGAIVGPIRGDYFWGSGKKAYEAAGLMKEKGKFFILLPRN